MDLREPLRLARKGDLAAFNRLVIDHQDQAYTLAYYLLGDENRAAAATHSAFLQAYAALGSFRQGSFRGWLLRWVLSACGEQAARQALAPEAGQAPGDLHRRLLSLPLDFRSTLILVDLLGLDYEEAAQASGCSPQAMSYRLARARGVLGSLAAGG